MTLTIELAPELETALAEVAARTGQDPASFARAAVEERLQRMMEASATPASEGETLDKTLAGLTGTIHIGPTDMSERTEELFGEIVEEKYRRQRMDI